MADLETSPMSSSFPKGWLEQSDYPAKKVEPSEKKEEKPANLQQPSAKKSLSLAGILGFLGHWPGSKPQGPEEKQLPDKMPNPNYPKSEP